VRRSDRKMACILDWIRTNQTVLWWLAAASAVTFVATVVFVPWWIVRLPADYFAHGKRRAALWADRPPWIRVALLLGKNVLGCVFLLLGLAMLVLPGQGLLTILVGIMLLDFPGKYRFERWIVSRRLVLRSVNWLRRKSEKSPLVLTTGNR
jgi:hypothetical protein